VLEENTKPHGALWLTGVSKTVVLKIANTVLTSYYILAESAHGFPK